MLEIDAAATIAEQVSPTSKDAAEKRRDSYLRCDRCRHPITLVSAAIRVDGQHLHHVVNPHGFEYRIGCFRVAPGCRAEGPRVEAFSWFQGYDWQIAHCESCAEHLGWRYECDGDAFFGLIRDKLSDLDEPRSA
ncbi:MAG: hypothetical protein KC609_13025 [Myxococcales bacterium]|nr:hypothetical protein [Myxococcales bacterium]